MFFGFSQNISVLYTIIDYPVTLDIYSSLHKKMHETSGLIFFDSDVWTFNDSGGKHELYRVDRTSGKSLQSVAIENATNNDWEDITQDGTYIYIGDFGNNAGNRKNLKIYKVRKDLIGEPTKENVSAEVISFFYGDQESYQERPQKNNFDCEALISFDNDLILFSKKWIDGETRMYKLSKEPGNYTINPECSFDTDGRITGADFNQKTKELVLVGIKDKIPFIFLFKEFDGKKLVSDNVFRINLPRLNKSQMEGICFLDENTVLISTEKTESFEQVIFKLNIRNVFKQSGIEYD